MASGSADRLALGALEAVMLSARRAKDERPAFELLVGSLAELGVRATPPVHSPLLDRERDAWLRRLQSARRSRSTLNAYRVAIDDLLAWAEDSGRLAELFVEQTLVDYLDAYRMTRQPAPATYHHRFVLLRRFMRWASQRNGLADPFLELQPPAKPVHESDWLTRAEFAELLQAAGRPSRRRTGLAERDQLVLLTLVTTGLRRSELIALDWRDVTLDGPRPSLLVRQGKGGRPRRQPLPAELARRLSRWRAQREASASDPVFCGLGGARLQPTILAGIIHRTATRAGIDKHVTAHTLRHTAATWLRQATGDTRLVAEYLGHADLSTVARYAHVAEEELHAAARVLAEDDGPPSSPRAARRALGRDGRVHPGQLAAWD